MSAPGDVADRLLRRALGLSAASVAFGLGLIAWFSRLPATADGIVPRAFGACVGLAFAALARSSFGRVFPAVAAYAALLLSAGLLGARAYMRWRIFLSQSPRLSAAQRAVRVGEALAGIVLLGLIARLGLTAALDVILNAAFPPESLSLLEPLALWLTLGAAFFGFLRAAAVFGDACLRADPFSKRSRRIWTRPVVGVIVPALGVWLTCGVVFQAGRHDLERAAGLTPSAAGVRQLWVLGSENGRPTQKRLELDLGQAASADFDSSRLAAAQAYLAKNLTVLSRTGLRYLYAGYAFEMDAAGLRAALLRGTRTGDPLARALLLENLRCAPASADNRAALEQLADESRYRIGGRAAATIAAVYARWGEADAARLWLKRVEAGPAGMPAGLLTLPEGATNGRIEGGVAGLRGGRVGLYCRPDDVAAYAIGPAQLVASANLDAKGRFRFERLSPGSYFLVLAKDGPRRPQRALRLLGHRGDLVLTRRRPRLEVRLAAR